MKKRAVLYARVSGDDRGKDDRNLKGQLDMCREYALTHDYQIAQELAEDDRGASGASFDLPELGRALEMAHAGEFDVLIVREIDRLSRNLAKQLIVEQEFKRSDTTIEYVLGEYPDTPEGRLNKHIKATIAEYEREKITERMVRGRRLKVKDGSVVVHGKPPLGYKVEKRDKKTVLVPYGPQVRIVLLIYGWYVLGDGVSGPLTMTAIANKLTEMKVPTWEDRNGRKRKHKPAGHWSKAIVAKILSNETYVGVWYYNKTQIMGEKRNKRPKSGWLAVSVPAIVDQELWEAAQERRELNRKLSKRNRKYNYLLVGRIRCGECGLSISGTATTRGPSKIYRYYICNGRQRDTKAHCKMPPFHATLLESKVWEWIKSFLTNPKLLIEGLKSQQAEREQANAPLRERLAVIDDLLAENQQQLQKLLGLYLEDDFPKDMLIEHKTRLEKIISGLEKERAGLMTHLEARIITSEQIQTIEEFAARVNQGLGIANNDFEPQLQVIEMLDVQVTLAIENEEYIAYIQCLVDEGRLLIKSNHSEMDSLQRPPTAPQRQIPAPVSAPGWFCQRQSRLPQQCRDNEPMEPPDGQVT